MSDLTSAEARGLPIRQDSMLANVAVLYYREGLNQGEIAQRMGVSRATIVNYLRQAREQQIVDIRIRGKSFTTSGYSREVKAKYQLEDVFVAEPGEVPGETAIDPTRYLAKVAAMALFEILREGDTLGVSWGKTIHYLSEELPFQTIPRLTVCQLIGSMRVPLLTAAESCTIRVSARTGADCYTLHAPAIVSTAELADALRAEPIIATQLAKFDQVNRALFSVGNCSDDTQLVQAGIGTAEDLRWYRARGAKGILCGRFIDADGQHIEGPLDRRMIGITPAQLRRIGAGILVSTGSDKLEAVRAVLNGRYASHLVIDRQTAVDLLA